MSLARLALAVPLLMAGLAASAEPLLVRSGEHRNFTRVVLPLPDGATYELMTEAGLSTVTFDGFADGFDLSEAFEIIPRTRLSALVGQPSRLELQLACDCPVNAFVERDRYLVLDIFDGPPLSETRVATARTLTSDQLPRSTFGFGQLLWQRGEIETAPEAEDTAARTASADGETSSRKAAEADRVLQTQTELLETFSRAASRGLLEPKQPFQPSNVEVGDIESQPEVFDSSLVPEDVAASPQGNIRITDSRDRPVSLEAEELTLSAATCPDAARVAIGTWGTAESFNTQFGRSNQMLVDEVGRSAPDEILERARLYLFFGFGAEALETLELFPGMTLAHPELVDLANILEFGHARNPRLVHQFADCDSDFALWGILAAHEMPPEMPFDAPAALRALEKLPSHLKYYVAQHLSERLLDRGDREHARIAMRSYERLDQHDPEVPKIIDAKHAHSNGESSQREAILDNIIAENNEDAPEALAELIMALIEDGKPVPADIALLAEAFAFEQRNSVFEREANETFILAAAASNQFEKAFDALLAQPLAQRDKQWEMLVTNVVSILHQHADDTDFIEYHYRYYSDLMQAVAAEQAVATAHRLFELGFIEDAERLVSLLDVQDQSSELRLLKAKLLVASGQYLESLEELASAEGPEASRLRAVALEGLGEHDAASKAFEEAGMPDQALSTLLLDEDWSRLVTPDTPLFGQLRELATALDDTTAIETDDVTLSRSYEAISESSSSRSVLSTTLEALRISEE